MGSCSLNNGLGRHLVIQSSCTSVLVTSSFLLLVVRPGAPSSFLFLVAMPFVPSCVLVTTVGPVWDSVTGRTEKSLRGSGFRIMWGADGCSHSSMSLSVHVRDV